MLGCVQVPNQACHRPSAPAPLNSLQAVLRTHATHLWEHACIGLLAAK